MRIPLQRHPKSQYATTTVCLIAAVVLAILILPIPPSVASDDVPSISERFPPAKQLAGGTPLADIECRDRRILLERDGRPCCVYEKTVPRLLERGWVQAATAPGGQAAVPVLGKQDHAGAGADPGNGPARPGIPDAGAVPAEGRTGHAEIPAGIAAANNGFAVKFYRNLASDENNANRNIFYSPSSMFTAFSALYEGASGDAVGELEDLFGFEPDEAARHEDVASLVSSINQDDPDAVLAIANGLWLRIPVLDGYLQVMRGVYLADVDRLPNDQKEAAALINGWASNNTDGKIDEVVKPSQITSSTVVVLANAINFEGMWEQPFPENATEDGTFRTLAGADVIAPLMHNRGTFLYAESGDTKVLRMPYAGDRLSMLVVLPKPGGMADLEGDLTPEVVDRWIRDATPAEAVDVTLPKFEFATKYDLKKSLMGMGQHGIFQGGGLAGIDGTDDLFVSHAQQDAFVSVNEVGTEAAAVTVVMMDRSVHPVFDADRPFLFIIRDDASGTILFMGRVADPTA